MTTENSSSSIPFSTGWDGKLNYKPEFKEMEETILQFDRKDIFDHDTEEFKNNYSAHILFRREYGDNAKQPKRVPNSFMIMKSVVKLIANHKNINCQDGKFLSKMCGLIWGSADPQEKKKFRQMAMEFERFHKEKFTHYKYSPPKRSNKNHGTIFEIKTPEYYQPGRQASSFPHQMNGMTILDHQASHQLEDEEMTYVDSQDLYGTVFVNNIPFQQQLESPEPTIAVNCAPLDPNASQATSMFSNNHPLDPSSTFENRYNKHLI